MNHLVALFLLAMALQPFDLQACAMGADQQPAHHAAMHDGGDAECCQPEPGDAMKNCGDAAHCAFLSLGFLMVPGIAGTLPPPPGHHFAIAEGDRYSGPPAPPLFRPPIA